MAEHDAPINVTPYDDEELEYFKKLLKEEKEQALEEIDNLKSSIADLSGTDEDNKSSLGHHQGDIGSDEEEKETLYRLLEREKNKIEKINIALDRIADKTYGLCMETGEKIQKERLKAIPYTLYSVNASKKDDAINRPPRV